MTAAEELAVLREGLRAKSAEWRERDDGSAIAWRVRATLADEIEALLMPALPVDAEERRGYVNRWERRAKE